MRAAPRMTRIVGASTDGRGETWLRVEYADGSVQDHELAGVPHDLKAAYVDQLARGGALGALGGQEPGDGQGLVDDLRRRGHAWLSQRIAEVSQVAAQWHEIERQAKFAGRADIAARARLRQVEVRKVHEALNTLLYGLFPEEADRWGGLGALTLLGAATVLISVGIVTTAFLVGWLETHRMDLEHERQIFGSMTPEERAGYLRGRKGPHDDGVVDGLVSVAKTLTVLAVAGYVGAKVVPLIAERVLERRRA